MVGRGGGGVTRPVGGGDGGMYLLAVRQVRGVHRDAVAQLTIRHSLYGTGKLMAVDRQRNHIMHARIAAHGAGHGRGRLLAFRRIDDVITGDLMNSDIGCCHVIHAHRMVCGRGRGITRAVSGGDGGMHLLAVRQVRGVHFNAVTQLAVRHWLHGAGKFMAVHRQRHHIMHTRIAAHGAADGGGWLLAFRRIEDVVTGNLMDGDIGRNVGINSYSMIAGCLSRVPSLIG